MVMYAILMSSDEPGPSGTVLSAETAAQLVEKIARNRDKTALSALFAMFAPRLKSMMLRLGLDEAQAEDLVQETLLSVWRKADQFKPGRGSASTWIFTIARNLRIDHARRLSNKPYTVLEDVDVQSDEPSAPARLETSEIVTRVGEALKTLPKDQREVVRLSYLNDMPQSAIAEKLSIPLGTVKSRMRLAYERLRPMLEDLH